MKSRSKKQPPITFDQLAILFEGLPPSFIGEIFISLLKTMGIKYPGEPFELDMEIFENQMYSFLSLLQKGLSLDEVVAKMIKQKKMDELIWRAINNTILQKVSKDELAGMIRLFMINGSMYRSVKNNEVDESMNKSSIKTEDNLPYAPNRKYQEWQFIEFEKKWIEKNSQVSAYDELSKKYPKEFPVDKMESFIVSFRIWNNRK